MQFMTANIRALMVKVLSGLCLVAIIMIASPIIPVIGTAHAAPVARPQHLAALFSQADKKAKSGLDQTIGAGTSRQLEGAVEQAAGTAQRQFGNVRQQAEGTARTIDGRAKQDLGRVEGAAEGIGSEVQDAAEGIADNVKDLIN